VGTTGGGGPDIVVADDIPVPETIITLGVGGVDLARDDVPRVDDDRVSSNGTLT